MWTEPLKTDLTDFLASGLADRMNLNFGAQDWGMSEVGLFLSSLMVVNCWRVNTMPPEGEWYGHRLR